MLNSHCKGRPGLSVAVIARNEADVLGDTLSSVRAIADQMIVVDTGSSDTTPLVAGKHGAQVLSCEWTDDFSAPRNRALREVHGEWVLWLDAGERLDAQTAESIRQFVTTEADPGKAFLLLVQVPAATPDGNAERVGRIRLVPNHPGVRFSGRIRETLRPSLEAAGISVELGRWTIHRSARDHDDEVKRRRAQRDVRIIEREMAGVGRTPRLLCALGDVCVNTGRRSQARELYQAAIAQSERGSTEMLEAYYGLLASFDNEPDQREAQLTACVQALEIYPFDAQLLCAMGSYLQDQGRADLACRSYEAAYQFGQVNPETWHLANISEVAARCLSINLLLAGDDAKAIAVLEEGLQRDPASLKLRRHLLDLLIRQGDAKVALAQVDHLPPETPHLEALRSAVRGACQAAKENWPPALAYLETAYEAGCRDPLCLKWLALCLAQAGKLAEAEPLVREWHEQEPHNPEVKFFVDQFAAPADASTSEVASAESTAATGSAPAVPTVAVPDLPDTAQDAPAAQTVAPAAFASSPKSTQHDELRTLRLDSARHPLDAGVHFRLGEAYRRQGDDEAAEAVWRDFLERSPYSPEVVRALCQMLLRHDRGVEALELLATCLAGESERPLAELVAGVTAAQRKAWQTARDRLQRSRDRGLDDEILLDRLADCQLALQRQHEAETLLRELVQRNPAHRSARERLARLLRASGRSGEAIALEEATGHNGPGKPHITSPRPSQTSVREPA